MMGLNDTYATIRRSVLMGTPLPTSGQAYNILQQEEYQREIHSGAHFLNESASLNASSSNYATQGSSSSNFQKRHGNDQKKSSMFCSYCKKPGHLIDKCFRIQGFPPDFKFTKSKRVAAQAEISEQSAPLTTLSPHSTSTQQSGILSPEMVSQIMNMIKSVQLTDLPSSANFAGNTLHTCFSTNHHITWIIDRAASDHMCHHKFISLNL